MMVKRDGCELADKVCGHGSSCFKCPFDECSLIDAECAFGVMSRLLHRSSKSGCNGGSASFGLNSLRELVGSFLISCQCKGLSKSTITTYKYNLRLFLDFVSEADCKKFSKAIIQNFLGHVRAERSLSGVTVRKYLVSLKAFFRWSFEEGFLDYNFCDGVKVGGIEKKTVKALSPGELKLFLQSLDKPIDRHQRKSERLFCTLRDQALVYVLVDCGLRVGELLALAIEDVDMRSRVLRVFGKGSRERYMSMSMPTVEAVAKYLVVRSQVVGKYHRAPGRLWLGRYGGLLTARGVQLEVAKLGERVGLKIYPHLLRHTFGTSFLRNGANTFEVQYALGHSTLSMTQRYCQAVGFDDVKKRHDVASPVSNALSGRRLN